MSITFREILGKVSINDIPIKHQQNNFYVYRYIRLDNNTPFYVGKGKGNRYINLYGRSKYFNNIIKFTPVEVEIIIENLSEEEAFFKEIEFIKLYKDLGYCEANLTNGGEGTSGLKMSDSSKIKMSLRKLGKKAKPFSEDHKRKLSITKQGDRNPMYGKKPIITELHREKISLSNTGRSRSTKHLNTYYNRIKKQVIDISNGYVWDSLKEASIIYSINYGYLKNMLSGNVTNKTNLRYI